MKWILIFTSILISGLIQARDREPDMIVDLRGQWKFEIGDSVKFANPKFDDTKWDNIFVPAPWEDEGYPGYDGYAWYRKTFTLPSYAKEKILYFNGGYIDDACSIYINGHLIGGKGNFPPHFLTAYNEEENFIVPNEYLNFEKENVVAIRVYDYYKFGGITRGKIGMFVHPNELNVTLSLPTLWKFKLGDEERWSDPSFDDTKWESLIVPTPWDYQGYADYDGFAWYRTNIIIPSKLQNEKLFVVLGKIDDVDETYCNGVKIGNTGTIGGSRWTDRINDEYQKIRIYRIPSTLIRYNQKNVIAIRVYDKMKFGGVCEGPVGIMTEEQYKSFMRNTRDSEERRKNGFEQLLDKIFNDQ